MCRLVGLFIGGTIGRAGDDLGGEVSQLAHLIVVITSKNTHLSISKGTNTAGIHKDAKLCESPHVIPNQLPTST